MQVKIGNIVYDPNRLPIMVILTEQDKINIQNMAPEATKYCAYPDTMQESEIEEFMKIRTDAP